MRRETLFRHELSGAHLNLAISPTRRHSACAGPSTTSGTPHRGTRSAPPAAVLSSKFSLVSPREQIGLREAAERLGVHYMTVYRYVRTGRLPAVRDGATWVVDAADLDEVRSTSRGPVTARRRQSERPARLANRMTAGDEAGAWAVVESALASGAEIAAVYSELLVPALRSIGDGWERGELSIAAEHRASVVASRLVARLGARFARRGRSRGSVVLGAPTGELHALPGAMLANLLRAAGFEPLDLGANTPAESFVETALGADRVVAVLIGATDARSVGALGDVVRSLRDGNVAAPVLVGGGAIRDAVAARALGADGWTGRGIVDALAAVEAVVAP